MKNRIFYSISICLLAWMQSSGQNLTGERDRNLSRQHNFFELGINVYQMDLNHGPDNNLDVAGSVQHNFFRGMMFRYVFGKNALRTNFDFYNQEVHQSDWESYLKEGRSKVSTFSVGYQRFFRKARFSPYVFADLIYRYSIEKGTERKGFYWNDYYNGPYKSITNLFSGAGGLGLRYNPFRSLVLNLESNVWYYFSTTNFIDNHKSSHRTRDYLVYPIRTSVSFIF